MKTGAGKRCMIRHKKGSGMCEGMGMTRGFKVEVHGFGKGLWEGIIGRVVLAFLARHFFSETWRLS